MISRIRDSAQRAIRQSRDAKDEVVEGVADAAARLAGINQVLAEQRETDNDWYRFSENASAVMAAIIEGLTSSPSNNEQLNKSLENLQSVTYRVRAAFETHKVSASLSKFVRTAESARDVSRFRAEFQESYNHVLALVNVDQRRSIERFAKAEDLNVLVSDLANIRVTVDQLGPRLDIVQVQTENIRVQTQDNIARMEQIETLQTANTTAQLLENLPYAVGASWDPRKVCLPGTRKVLLDEISDWITAGEASRPAEICWIVDVAGSGKTALAHSICQRADKASILVSCFFFDRMFAERNTTDKVITTLARDLASLDSRIAAAMTSIVESKVSIRSAAIMLQFAELILKPSVFALLPRDRPALVVLDGLDKASSDDLLEILQEDIHALPGNFRFVVTSRPELRIVSALDGATHVRKADYRLHGKQTLDDIATYVSDKTAQLASKHRKLPNPWPTAELRDALIMKSEGFFQWVSTVIEFLGRGPYPDKRLNLVLSLSGAPTMEGKMDELYTTVLSTCPWEDEDFVNGYCTYMGTIVVSKEPLSCATIQALHGPHSLKPGPIFNTLASVVIGGERDNQKIQIIHLSLRDYLTVRAPEPYHVHKAANNELLARLCLRVLVNHLEVWKLELSRFDMDDEEHLPIPAINPDRVSEEMRYATSFWLAHMVDIEEPKAELAKQMIHLLKLHLLQWVKFNVCLGGYQSLSELREWLMECACPTKKDILCMMRSLMVDEWLGSLDL